MKAKEKIFMTGIIIMAFTLLPWLSIAGPLEPPAIAVDPLGNPVPTMKTLDEIPPAWSQKLRADDGDADGCNSSRFKCVLDGQAVLDKETGLVWERSPENLENGWLTWDGGQWSCSSVYRGGRAGWRLPTLSELLSLQDYCPSQTIDQRLPCGHPFNNVSSAYRNFWSATTWFFDSNRAIAWSPYSGHGSVDKSIELWRWCVRGGIGSSYVSD
ncbi:MAG: DUF1566 domain-containing protein [Thermodesulfovibrionales bacterium]|nr:DUF1566 domain-containing protein [Thermodesulfovibrionales bacterium]